MKVLSDFLAKKRVTDPISLLCDEVVDPPKGRGVESTAIVAWTRGQNFQLTVWLVEHLHTSVP
jgi:hypothetical protein